MKQVRELLSRGGDIGASENDGCSILHAAALGGSVECAQLLVAAGHPINPLEENGQTPIHQAAGEGWYSAFFFSTFSVRAMSFLTLRLYSIYS